MKPLYAFIFFIWTFSTFAQTVTRDELALFYNDTNAISFHPSADEAGWKQIIVVRHGKPDVSISGWVKRGEVDDYLKRYVTSSVQAIDSSKIILEPGVIDTIYSSSLNRAYNTAQLIARGHFPIKQLRLFREFENRAAAMPNLKLPKGLWLGTSRILWLLGLNQKNIEPHKAARLRAKKAANHLGRLAVENNRIILVAHGFLNRYLDKYLRQQGWLKIRDDGHDYLAAKVFVMRVANGG